MPDALLQLSDAQAVTATAVSTNTIDLGTARDLGPGTPLYANITVDVSATAAGAATVTFQVISATDAALTTSVEVLASTDAIGKADLTAGRDPIAIAISPSVLNELGQRYLGVNYVVATGPLTAGKFTAYIEPFPAEGTKSYPSGYVVT